MEGDGAFYNSFKQALAESDHDLGAGGHILKLMLVHGYVPDIDVHAVKGDVATEYPTGLGYTAGGATLAGQNLTLDLINNCAVLDGIDVFWLGLGPLIPATPSHAVLYDDTSPTKQLICYWELGITATLGTKFRLRFAALGIARIT